jgi:hypothetical protein
MSENQVTSVQESTNNHSPPQKCRKMHTLEKSLSAKKRLAIQLLVFGHSDQDVADKIGVNRTTINRWRLYHPTFQTELNRQRQSLWLNQADRLRSMISAALNILQSHLASQSERASFRAAVSIIRLAARLSHPSGPTDEYDLLKQYRLREHAEQMKYESEMSSWPIPKEDLDNLREYLLRKAKNQPLDPPKHKIPQQRSPLPDAQTPAGEMP